MTNTYQTREAWLCAAADMLAPMFADAGAPLPDRIRYSVGFMGGRSSAKLRAIGQCWDASASADGTTEIFIHPSICEPVQVLSILAHELVHAAVGVQAGHKGPFKRVALAIGLEGKMESTNAGSELAETLTEIADLLGPLPHAKLDGSHSGPKKQAARMIKATCECGYLVRLTRKWLDEVGPPHCPLHGQMSVEGGDTDDGE